LTTRTSAPAARRASALAALALCTLALVVLPAAPAQAHGRGSDATNYVSRILSEPDIPGLEWNVYGGDELLEVVNTTDAEVVILGYTQSDPEPYLRVGPDGVWENRNSPATYVNADRRGQVDVPPGVDGTGEPDWVKVSDGNSATWHDHGMHYMGTGLHASITDPSRETVVFERWQVPFLHAGEEHVVAGDLRWVPGPPVWPWLLAGLALSLPALVGLRSEPTSQDRWPGLARPAAVVLGLIVALNVTHLVDDLLAVPLPASATAVAAAQTAMFLAIGAFGVWRGWQAGDGAFTALGVASGAVFVGQGLLYASVLGVSQISSVFPDALARLTVGLSIAQVVPLGIVVVIGTRRLLPPLPEAEHQAAHAPA
jgi:hypothetical protein